MAKWDMVMCTCVFLKFCVCEIQKNAPNASSEPTLLKEKWPTCLGHNVRQLKKWVGSIPITMVYKMIKIVPNVEIYWVVLWVGSPAKTYRLVLECNSLQL